MNKLICSFFSTISNLLNTFLWVMLQLKNENFKNYIHKESKNNPFVILANGPSLGIEIPKIEKMVEVDFCALNDFCIHPLFSKIKPKYYVLADSLYFYSNLIREKEKFTYESLSRVSWPMVLFIPFYALKQIKGSKFLFNNSNIKVVAYHTNDYNGFERIKLYLYSKGFSMPRVQNVVIPCIFNAINMGYSKIYLYGVDHSWTQEIRVDNKNRVCLRDKHFYDDNEVNLTPWLTCHGEQFTMHEILRTLSYTFEGYHQLNKYAEVNNCQIVNMTKGSFIDAFNRN